MRIDVVILPDARYDLIRLLEPRLAVPSDAVSVGYVYLDDIEQQFTTHTGYPPGARPAKSPDGSEW